MRLVLNTLVILLIFLAPLSGQKEVLEFEFGNNRVTTSSLAFTPDGNYLFAGGYLKQYELQTGKETWRARKKDTETNADLSYLVKVSPDNRLCLATKLRKIEIWDLNQLSTKPPTKPLKVLSVGNLTESAVCFSPAGDSIIYMTSNGEINFTDAKSFQSLEPIKITGESPVSVTVTPDGEIAVVGTRSGNIILYDIRKNKTSELKVPTSLVFNVAVSPDGKYLAASTSDGQIWLGEFPELAMRRLGGHDKGFTPLAFHPSGGYLASGGGDNKVVIWKLPERTAERKIEAHARPVTALAFSPDGVFLATGCENVPTIISNVQDTKLWSLPVGLFAWSPEKKLPLKQEIAKPAPATILSASSGGKRLALVIGNGAYFIGPLANPENDARAMKEVLVRYGFEVMEYRNLTQANMKRVIDEFGERLKGFDVGLFFYAGHGIQSKGYNYLIPTDADLKSEQDVEYDCTPADRILGKMEAAGTKVNIIILDACRNNPFERGWTRAIEGKGLATMDAPNGSIIELATDPGETASDGTGENGLFTSAILESIRPGISIIDVFMSVTKKVEEASGGKQRPWQSLSLTEHFYF